MEGAVGSDFPLPASVLLSLFHLLAQHYCAGITAGSYKRPYRPIRSLVVTKAMFILEMRKHHRQGQSDKDLPGRITRQRMPEAITMVF